MKRHSNKHGATYSASISYTYQVAGIYYTASRLAFGGASGEPAHVQKVLDRFPVGKKIPVYYFPTDPQLAVLEPGVHGGTWICFGVGTVFVLFGCMSLQIQAAIPEGKRFGTMKTPPVLMGVICIVMGSFVCFMEPSGGTPKWVLYAAGGFFVLIGLFILDYRSEHRSDDE